MPRKYRPGSQPRLALFAPACGGGRANAQVPSPVLRRPTFSEPAWTAAWVVCSEPPGSSTRCLLPLLCFTRCKVGDLDRNRRLFSLLLPLCGLPPVCPSRPADIDGSFPAADSLVTLLFWEPLAANPGDALAGVKIPARLAPTSTRPAAQEVVLTTSTSASCCTHRDDQCGADLSQRDVRAVECACPHER